MEPAIFSLENGAWYVAPSGSDSNSCFSLDSPCGTIQSTISKASKGDTIFVALGVYDGSDGVSIPKSLTILGGWDNSFTNQVGQSTIQGSIGVGSIYDSYQKARMGADYRMPGS
jgi:hypothetical protein